MNYSLSILLAVALGFGFAACAHDHANDRDAYIPPSSAPADNTKVNADGGLTAQDQSTDPDDREISRHIRRTIVQDQRLSVSAKNVKIITRDGYVTLRGPVANATERRILVAYARDIAGPGHVRDQLQIP